MIEVGIDNDTAKNIAVQYISEQLVIMKQYLSEEDVKCYKHMIHKHASLVEVWNIRAKYDRAWPSDLKWETE